MKTAGIICEYNPFHNGHLYHLTKTRENGATHIIAVMSGNFVQRGDVSIIPKDAKVQMAVDAGADLVLELPAVWAMSGAESFAKGAVSVLKNTGVTDFLSFGSECGDIKKLKSAAEAVNDTRVDARIKKHLEQGVSFAAARSKAVRELYGEETAKIISEPNDILGIEYLNALSGTDIEPIIIKRDDARHDSKSESPFRKSASEIREMILREDASFQKAVPPHCRDIIREYAALGQFPVTVKDLDRSVCAVLRRLEPEDFRNLPDVSEGLEFRIYNAVRQSSSLDEILMRSKCKRYTMARIRRIILDAYLGIGKGYCGSEVPYIRVLGMNEKGKEILKEMREKAKKPIIMKYADFKQADGVSRKIFDIESRATDLYSLGFDKPSPCGTEMTRNIYIAE